MSPPARRARAPRGMAASAALTARLVAAAVEAAVRNGAPRQTVAAAAASAVAQVFAICPPPPPLRPDRRGAPAEPAAPAADGRAAGMWNGAATSATATPRGAKRPPGAPGDTPLGTPTPAALEAPPQQLDDRQRARVRCKIGHLCAQHRESCVLERWEATDADNTPVRHEHKRRTTPQPAYVGQKSKGPSRLGVETRLRGVPPWHPRVVTPNPKSKCATCKNYIPDGGTPSARRWNEYSKRRA